MFPASAFGGANSAVAPVVANNGTSFFTATPFGTAPQTTFGENGGTGSGSVFGGGASAAAAAGDENHAAKRSQTFSKNRSNDADHHRKQREEKANQLRKEKRNEQTMNNRKRPKFDTKESNNEDMTVPTNSNQPVALAGNIPANSNFARLYDVTVWQKKTEQLSSPVRELRLGAMEYLRRILTVDRNPPIDLLLNSCTAIIPSMIRLLKDHSAPEIQFEAAWAITNLACGELQYVQILLQVQMMDHLMEVIMSSKEWMVKDQCLWALFNISTEEEACQYFIQQEHYLMAILGLLGITVEAPNNALLESTSSNKPVKKSVVMINPSLSIMRHVAFIFCNIIKMKELQAPYLLKGIFQAFIELLQSPDDEIISDILVTLASSTPHDNHQIQLIQECGIISRLCELVDHSTHTEQALHALASTIQTSDPLQAKSVLYEFHNRHRRSGESSCAAMTGTGCLHVNGHLQQQQQSQQERDFLDGVNTSLFDSMVQFLNQHMHRWQQQQQQQPASQQSFSSNHDAFLNTNQSPSHVNSIMQSPQVQQYASSSSSSSSSSSASSSSVSTPFNTQASVPLAVKDHQGSAKMFKSLQGNILTPVKDIKASQQAATDMFLALEQILSYKAPHFLLRRREYENRESMKSLMSMLCNCCRYFMLSQHMAKLNAAASSCFCAMLEVYGQLLVEIDLNALLELMINLIQCHDDRVLHRALLIWQGYLSSPHPLTPPAAFHAFKQKLSLLKFYAIPDIVQLAGSLDEQLNRLVL